MNEFLTHTLPEIIGQLSPLAYLLVFAGGILTSLGPCNISMAPVLIGYVAGQENVTRKKAFCLACFFTLGSAATFTILGLIAAAVGVLAGKESKALHWFAAAVCLIIGLKLLGALKLNFDFLSRLQPKRVAVFGPLGALLLGMTVGLAGSQCGTPILIAILGIALAKSALAYGALLLFIYGLGRGVPLIIAGTFTGLLKSLPALEPWTAWINKFAGVMLILVGLYFVWIA